MKTSQNWRVVNSLTCAALQLATSIGIAAMEWEGHDIPENVALSALKRHHESLGLLIKDMEAACPQPIPLNLSRGPQP